MVRKTPIEAAQRPPIFIAVAGISRDISPPLEMAGFAALLSRAAASKPCQIVAPEGSFDLPFAGVAELVDARDLGSRDESRGGSNPSARTMPRV